jgi:AhpD family alkylhydroperoxidase
LDPVVAELVRIRVSQLNGCGFCLDLHSTAARAAGVDPRRLATLAGWRLAPFYSRRERAALALAEAVTLLPSSHDIDQRYDEAIAQFTEAELAALLWTIAGTNAWNRVAVATRTAAG